MKKHYFLLFAFLFLSFFSQAQWVALNSTITDPIEAVCFKDNNNGFAVTATFASGGKIMATTNGQTWSQNYSCPDYLFTIQFPSDEVGYTGGGDIGATTGAIYKTTSGGVSWSKVNATILPQVYSVYFTDDTIGYAATNDATTGHYYIYKTVNGGVNWTQQSTGFDYIRHLFFSSDSVGYVAGDNGRIFKTTNAGTTWTLLTTNVVFHFNASYFINDQEGWMVGAYGNGGVYKTTNGGATWVNQPIPTIKGMSGVWFTSATDGWVTGEDGTLLHTANGGTTWTTVTPVNTNWNFAITFPSPTVGYAVGANGNIIKYTTATGLNTNTTATAMTVTGPDNDRLIVHGMALSDQQDYRIFSADGRLVKCGKVNGNDDGIDVSRLTAGCYILQLSANALRYKFVRD